MTMRFNWQGESQVLHGQKDPSSMAITLRSLEKDIDGGGALFALLVKEVEHTKVSAPQMPTDIDKILEEFAAIFEEPRSLPPFREVDH